MVLRLGWRKLAGLAAMIALIVVLTGCVPADGTGANDPQAASEVIRTFVGDFVRQLMQAALL